MRGIMNVENLYWVGLTLSELTGIEYLFKGAIVLQGQTKESTLGTIFSYEEQTSVRLNYDNPDSFDKIDDFYIFACTKIIENDKNSKFLWYATPELYYPSAILKKSNLNADSALVGSLNNKLRTRSLFKQIVPVIEPRVVFLNDLTIDSMKRLFPGYSKFVVQNPLGEGGHGTFVIQSKKDLTRLKNGKNGTGLISPYYENAIPLNVHIIAFSKEIMIFNPSVQIITLQENRLLYGGCDYSITESLDKRHLKKIKESAKSVGDELKRSGYIGVAGIDFLALQNGEMLLVEINPRFQGSTTALNLCLKHSGLPSIQELHIKSFFQEKSNIDMDQLNKVSINKSQLLGMSNKEGAFWFIQDVKNEIFSPDMRDTPYGKEHLNVDLLTDGGEWMKTHQPYSHPFKILMDCNALGWTTKNTVKLMPSLKKVQVIENYEKRNISKNDISKIATLKFDLLSCGIRLSEKAMQHILASRKNYITIRDGIGGGLDIKLFDDIYISVPFKEKFSFLSPYEIRLTGNSKFAIFLYNEHLVDIDILPQPQFVGKRTASGVLYEDIAQLFTDRLSLAIFWSCINATRYSGGCHFCELSEEPKYPPCPLQDLLEVFKHCNNSHSLNMKHVLISGGTPCSSEWKRIPELINEIRKVNDIISIYYMTEPNLSNEQLKTLFKIGLNEIAFNLEIFDRDIAKTLMPRKGQIPLSKYQHAFESSVALWGNTGAVRSILIVGLEPAQSTLNGVEFLCRLGVMPILSPFRPIPGTKLKKWTSFDGPELFFIWQEAQKICEDYDQTLGPLCKACQNNTISLPINEKYS